MRSGHIIETTYMKSDFIMKPEKAKIKYPNGEIYIGQFQDFKRHGGKGKMYFKDGSTFEGNWTRDEQHGEGVTVNLDKSEHKAVWDHGIIKQVLYY